MPEETLPRLGRGLGCGDQRESGDLDLNHFSQPCAMRHTPSHECGKDFLLGRFFHAVFANTCLLCCWGTRLRTARSTSVRQRIPVQRDDGVDSVVELDRNFLPCGGDAFRGRVTVTVLLHKLYARGVTNPLAIEGNIM